jgi:hypothetical protein
MNDHLSRLRADADAEISESSDALVPADADLPEDLERLLANHYASEPTSQMFTAALEALSQSAAWPDAPTGRAAKSATFRPSARARTVGEALNVPISQARSTLAGSLNIRRPRGEVFKAIADSCRMSGGYVYPYRPGPTPAAPAKRVDDDADALGALISWGRELFQA